MRLYAAVILLLLSAARARAGAGSDALAFLKVDSGARGAALSGAYSAAGDDALSVFYNPAGTALLEKKEILLGHNEWLEGIRNETLAYVHPLGPRLTAFAGVNLLMSGKMDRYVIDQAGNPEKTGAFSALEGAVSAGLSGMLAPGLYGGAALKSLSQQAAGDRASSFAGDAGFVMVSETWRIGGSASNFGGKLKFGSKTFSAPVMIRGGVSRSFLEDYMVCAEAVKAGQSDLAGAFGAEARMRTGPKEYFLVRAGYKTGRSRFAGPGVTAGVGVASRDLRVDYAFAPYGDLGAAHRVTVSLRFGEKRAEYVDRKYGGLPPKRAKKPAAPERSGGTKKADEKKKDKKDPADVYFMW